MKIVKFLLIIPISSALIWLFVSSCGDKFVVAPEPLSVTLTAAPASGSAPLDGVDLTARVTGTGEGPITYRFDCNNDSSFDLEATIDDDSHTAVDICDYTEPGAYVAKVEVERGVSRASALVALNVAAPSPSSPTGDTVTVAMKDNFFEPRDVTLSPGTTIVWPNVGERPHTSTSDDGLWDSGTINPEGAFSWTVPAETPSGALPYFCIFHGDRGGIGMAGVINVDDGTAPPAPVDTVTVAMKDNFFSPRDVTVDAGTIILWENLGLMAHTSTSDVGIWDSGTVERSAFFSWTVPSESEAGANFPYFCIFHGDPGGFGMAGTIRVTSDQPSLSVALTAEPASGEAPLSGVDLQAQVGGTATGEISYRFDCTGDGVFEHEVTNSTELYTAVDVCTYTEAGTYTAKVLVEREGLSAEATTTVAVSAAPPPPSGTEISVEMKDNFFSPKEVTVKPGTKINWPNVGARPHTSTSDDGIWDSGTINTGESFSWTVPASTASGTSFPYFCVFHGASGGIGMAGTIQVDASPPSDPTLSVVLSAEPGSGEAPLSGVDLQAQVSGTATGQISYRFDCTDDGSFEHEVTNSSESYTAVDVCTYAEAGSYTAKVLVEREGVSAEATTSITVDAAPPGEEITVEMKDNFFSPKEVTVKPGTKINWPNVGARPHTSTSDDGIWDSGTINTGETYSWTVPASTGSGTSFPYFCVFHGASGGIGMAGTIQVDASPPSDPTLSVVLSAEPGSGEAPLSGVDLQAQVSGTATGQISYRFDCTGDGSFEHEVTNSSESYTAVDVCTYAETGSYTAKVLVEREGVSAEATATITVTAPPPPVAEITIEMRENVFSPKEVTVKPGTKINWPNVGARPHTSTSDDGVWNSGTINPGLSYSWTVPASTASGTSFPYYCVFHGASGGIGMAGTLHVDANLSDGPVVSAPAVSQDGGHRVIVTTSGPAFSPEIVEIRPGESVVWQFSGTTHNVVFEDKAPPDGDIPDSAPGSEVARKFPAMGDYDYECTLHSGQKGRIRVQQN